MHILVEYKQGDAMLCKIKYKQSPLFIYMTEEVSLQQIEQQVKAVLKLPTEDTSFHRHIANILIEQPPINGPEIYEMVSDFFDLFHVNRVEALKKCDALFNSLKNLKGFLKNETKYKLTAEQLGRVVILEEELKLEDARQPLFAKKPTAGNSNNEMTKWSKKQKGKNPEMDKAAISYERHIKQIEKKSKQLPPVQIRRQREAVGGRTNDLILDNISLVIAGKTLLQGTTLKLAYGRKYGLVGRNGIGKTCLMNALARGQFPKTPTHLQILLVEQEIRNTHKTVLATVLETDVERQELFRQQQLLEKDQNNKNAAKRLNQIYKRLQQIEANKAESKAATILGGLGFTPNMLNRTVGSLSGGWRMRVALARALFVQPDILLLDEPTNHLDLDAVMWLEDYVSNCKNTVVIVSHAREFLNVTCNEIVHYYNEKLHYYKGNYDVFEKLRIENRDRQKRDFESQQMKLDHMQKFIDKFRFNAKRASLVQSRIKAINKMQLVEQVIQDPTCVFIFPSPDKLRPPLLRIEDGYFSYKQDEHILRNVNFAVDMESRIAIVGANGVGKSTLLKLLVGSLQLTTGNQYRNQRLSLSMFTQHHIDQLKLPLSPLEQFMTDFPGSTVQTYRSHLGSFGVTGNLALRPNYLLSGGQKSRVAFALAMWKNPHILVLDEPTNHLDIDAVNALIVALNNYNGGVIIVSHDQHLISTVCEEIWYIKDTRLKKFAGDFEDYRRMLSLGKL